MGKISRYIGSQFGNPRGFVGRICCVCMNIINRKMYMKIVSYLSGEKCVLDIGYGNGFLIKEIYKKTSAKIKGIDISEDMKIAASKRNEKGVSSNDIELSIGDCCDLIYEDKTFDAVTTVNTIYFWSDTLKGLTEIKRVLRDNGTFYNAVYTKDWMERTSYTKEGFKLFEKDEYIELGKAAGFTDVQVVDIIEGTNFLVIYKK